MQKLYFFVVVAALALIAIPSTARANLLTNPGFELNETDWSFFSSGATATHSIQTPGYAGSSKYGENLINVLFGTITPMYAGYYQAVNDMVPGAIKPGQLLYLSGAVKASGVTSGMLGQLQVEFYNSYLANSSTRIWGSDIRTAAVTANQGWTYYQTAGYVPSTAKMFQLVTLDIGLISGATGTFGYDEVWVDYQPIPEPVSLLLFGSGLVGMLVITRRKGGH